MKKRKTGDRRKYITKRKETTVERGEKKKSRKRRKRGGRGKRGEMIRRKSGPEQKVEQGNRRKRNREKKNSWKWRKRGR